MGIDIGHRSTFATTKKKFLKYLEAPPHQPLPAATAAATPPPPFPPPPPPPPQQLAPPQMTLEQAIAALEDMQASGDPALDELRTPLPPPPVFTLNDLIVAAVDGMDACDPAMAELLKLADV
jgi:hypothetical protein